jgi:hypothetical protein
LNRVQYGPRTTSRLFDSLEVRYNLNGRVPESAGGICMNSGTSLVGGSALLPGFAASAMVTAIRVLYRVAGEINEFIDDHIDALKRSDSPLIASTGRVLEAAKFGFGLGYASSVVLIAVGQYLLGNTLGAVATVASAAVLSNPIAMTCGAMGAIYYGWHALNDKERAQLLERLSGGLAVGVELIRSLIDFVIRKSREVLTSSQLEEAKRFIKDQAALFGKTLYEVTGKLGDLVRDGVDKIGEALDVASEKAGDVLKHGADKTGEVLSDAKESIGELTDRARQRIGRSESVPPTPMPESDVQPKSSGTQ